MEAVSLIVGPQDVQIRIRQRLTGLNREARGVVWQLGGHSVLIHTESLQARFLRGWLLVSLFLETNQTGRCLLEFVFFLGAAQDGDGNTAAARINAASRAATQLAEIWGDDLQRVIWDAVLDVMEASLSRVRHQYGNQPMTLRGFQVSPEGLQVSVIAGEL